MRALTTKIVRIEAGDGYTAAGYGHWCPGCRGLHVFAVDQPFHNGARWTFNGDVHAPTFKPSMRIACGNKVDPDCKYGGGVCHYHLNAGRIQFLGDCTHALANTTVDLPDLPYRYLMPADGGVPREGN